MKKLLSLSALALTVLFSSCAKQNFESETAQVQSEKGFTVNKARQVYSSAVALTKTVGSNYDSTMMSEILSEDWESALESSNGFASSVDVPATFANKYHAQYNGDHVDVIQRLLVMEGGNLSQPWAYLYTIIPTPEYMAAHGSELLKIEHTGNKYGFSGKILFHNLEGLLLRINTYENGKLTDGIYMVPYYYNYTYDQVMSMIESKLEGIKLYGENIKTRCYANSYEIEPVIVYGSTRAPLYERVSSGFDCSCTGRVSPIDSKNYPMRRDPSESGGGGGGGAGSSTNPVQPIIDISAAKAQELLDLLFSKGKLTYEDIGINTTGGIMVNGVVLKINNQDVFVASLSFGLKDKSNSVTTSYKIEYNKMTRYGQAQMYILYSDRLSISGNLIPVASITVLCGYGYEKIIEAALDK